MLLSPQVGLAVGEADHDSEKSDEQASPDRYAVTLKRWGIRAEMSPTHNGAMYRFTYPQTDDAVLLLDASHSIAEDIAKEMHGRFFGGEVKVTSLRPLTIEASGKYQGGFGHGPYSVYVVVACDRDAVAAGTCRNGTISPDNENLWLAGNVVGIRDEAPGHSKLTIQTDYLHIQPRTEKADTDRRVTISDGPLSLFGADGSAIIIHANEDQGITGEPKSGVSGGPRLACGVIQKQP